MAFCTHTHGTLKAAVKTELDTCASLERDWRAEDVS
jgi:hypothetical protein